MASNTTDAPERGPEQQEQQREENDTRHGESINTDGDGGDPDWMDAEDPEAEQGDLSPKEQEEVWDEVVRGTDSDPDENPTAYFPIEGRGELEFEITPIKRRKMSSLKRRYPPGMLRAIQQEENGEKPEFTPDMNPTEDETDALETTVKRSFYHPEISPHQLQQYMDDEWGEAALFKAATLAMGVSSAAPSVQSFRVESGRD